MAFNQKAPDKGGFPAPIDAPGNFAPDAQIVILERVCRCLEEKVHKAIEELRAVRQVIEGLQNDQFDEKRRRDRQQQKDLQLRNRTNEYAAEGTPAQTS
jgi:hypothetical protein